MASAHVVIFPFMAQGHTLPLLDISNALARRGLKVTIITTPSNAPFILSKTSKHPEISLSIIPFPRIEELPEGCENTANLPSMDLFATFITSTKKMKQPFEHILEEMFESGCGPICVMSDFFLSWTLDSCNLFGIPRVVSHGMGVLSLAILKIASLHAPRIQALSDSDSINLPDLKIPFSLYKSDLPGTNISDINPDDRFFSIVAEFEEADANSWGLIVNSFEELEGEYISALESLNYVGGKAWCVGPVLLYNENQNRFCPSIKWLDEHESSTVIYISFGTQAHLSDIQLDEIAFGLEMAGHPFIWAVRSTTWAPPEGWEERIKRIRGWVVREWVEQRSILAHPAIAGFLSHCGWNSVVESLSMGVPILGWPESAEQPLNAKMVAAGHGAGIFLRRGGGGGGGGETIVTVDRGEVCDGVKELMGGEKGREVRERARELGKMARKAVENGGSSDKKLDELVECLVAERERR